MKSLTENNILISVYTDDFFEDPINIKISEKWKLTDVIPTEEQQKYIKCMFDGNTYYEGATSEEVEAYEEAITPNELTSRQFWIAVYKLLSLTEDQVINVIEQIPISDFFTEETKEMVIISCRKSQVFERKDSLLKTFIPVLSQILGIEININQIFSIGINV